MLMVFQEGVRKRLLSTIRVMTALQTETYCLARYFSSLQLLVKGMRQQDLSRFTNAIEMSTTRGSNHELEDLSFDDFLAQVRLPAFCLHPHRMERVR